MKKHTKILIAVLVIAILLAGGLWLYWEREIPLQAQLPDEQWHDVTLVAIVFENSQIEHKSYTVDEEASEEIMEALRAAKTERRRRFDDTDADSFWIVISVGGEEHGMWSLLLGENGLLSISDPDGKAHYFEGCQDLYRQIKAVADELPLK